jgi:class 3 adenylate cyclase
VDKSFRELFDESDRLLEKRAGKAAMDALYFAEEIGHPKYQNLSFDATAEAEAVVMFLDIRGFTSLSLELENDELVRILQKLTAASVKSVRQFGGYIGEFTGDGVMAYFDIGGPAFAALHTASFLMSGVRDVVNPALKRDGDTGVRVAVGMEYGRVLWAPVGIGGISQVKPISEVTFIAGKLSTRKYAKPWQCKVGQQLAAAIPEEFKSRAEGYAYGDRTYPVFDFDWEQFAQNEKYNLDALKRRVLAEALSPRVRTIAGSAAGPAVISGRNALSDPPRPPRSRQVG